MWNKNFFPVCVTGHKTKISWPRLKAILNDLVYIFYNVSEPPEVPADVPQKSSHTVLLHRRLVLKCPLHGSPPPKITWYKVSLSWYEHSVRKLWNYRQCKMSHIMTQYCFNRKEFPFKNNLEVISMCHQMATSCTWCMCWLTVLETIHVWQRTRQEPRNYILKLMF